MSWQPIETAPIDGRWLLLWCDFGDGDSEPLVGKYTHRPSTGREPSGPFVWKIGNDGGSVAERVPTYWKPVGKPRGRRK